jgi:phospholipase/carboxylesterase
MPLGTHKHIYLQGSPGGRTLLLLHGTGGDEHSLVRVGRMIDPDAHLLGVRGNVLEGTAPRFFRRLAEGVFDEDDMLARTHALAAWIEAACAQYAIASDTITAVGYSNGANVAAAMLYLHPGLLRRAVLLRAMSVFRTSAHSAPVVDLTGTRVFIASGRFDPIMRVSDADALAFSLRERGADVTMQVDEGDHSLTQAAVEAARDFVAAD